MKNMKDLAAEYEYDLRKDSYEGAKVTFALRIYPETRERLDYIAKAVEKAPGTVACDILLWGVDQLAAELSREVFGRDSEFWNGYVAIGQREFKEATGIDSSDPGFIAEVSKAMKTPRKVS